MLKVYSNSITNKYNIHLIFKIADSTFFSSVNVLNKFYTVLSPHKMRGYDSLIVNYSVIYFYRQLSQCSLLMFFREDCFKVLSVCLDWSRMSQTVSAADVCSELAPSDPSAPCISLNPFLTPSEEGYTEAITKPCLPDPCSPSELCTVARNCAPSDVHCRPYRCLPGRLICFNYHCFFEFHK